MYKLIASDLDGTLLQNDKSLSQENDQAIYKIVEKGVHFVPCSGRGVFEIPTYVREHPAVRYVIGGDGSMLYDRVTGEQTIWGMERDVKAEVLDIFSKYQVSLSIRYKGECYVKADEHDVDTYRSYRYDDAYIDFLYAFSHPVDDFDTFCRDLDEIEMICAFFKTDEEWKACQARMDALNSVQTAICNDNSFEVFSANAGKGKAMLHLASKLGIDQSETIAVGDTINDRTSVETAGLGLAMGNAYEELKAIADEVVCRNDEHVAPYILERYL